MAYEDLNTKFTVTSDINQAEIYPLTSGLNSIKQGLERLLTTPKGHDPFNREYGSSLYNLLFENTAAINTIQMFLYMDITKWEPRVDISPSGIEIVKLDSNTYRVSCNFIANGYNASGNITTVISRE
jgi:phage baseplate assembly protein W